MSEKYLKVKKTPTSNKRKRVGDDQFTLACNDCAKCTLVSTTSINQNLRRQNKLYWVFESNISSKIAAYMFHEIETDEDKFKDKFFQKLMAEKAWT